MFSKHSTTLVKPVFKQIKRGKCTNSNDDINELYIKIGACVGAGGSTVLCAGGSNSPGQFFGTWLILTPWLTGVGGAYGVMARFPIVRELLYGTTGGLLLLCMFRR